MIEELVITNLSGRGAVAMKKWDPDGYWLGPVDWGSVQVQHQTYRYVNQVGESVTATILGSRGLSVNGWVMGGGTDTLQSRCDFLNSFFSPAEDYQLEYRGRLLTFRPDGPIQYGHSHKENNRLLRKFLLQATAHYPLFTDKTAQTAPFDQSGRLFRFPQSFGLAGPVVFGTADHSYSMEIVNAGGFQTGITARFRFTGTVKDPAIANRTTGKLLRVLRTFQRGEQLEIVSQPGEKRMTLTTAKGVREDVLKSWDFSTSWVELAPGRNLLALECPDPDQRANMTVTALYTPLYLEVE